MAGGRFTFRVSMVVALGGFLMGFDASVISGVVGAVESEFELSKIGLGWVVASLSLTAALGMLLSGPASDRFGRRPVLIVAALVFFLSAVASAVAPSAEVLAAARMLGGFAVGAALVIAPIYIAEIAPARDRGRLVSLNQFNIVIGISAAFFSNYFLLQLIGDAASAWRWMLGVEAVPAVLYFFCLLFVPESPRWLLLQGREEEAVATLRRAGQGGGQLDRTLAELRETGASGARTGLSFRPLLAPGMRRVLFIGLIVAVLQQASGINAIFFYAPMIFEQSGIGTDAAFMQATLVGVTNLLFTLVAMALIDRLGRRPLLLVGTAGIAVALLTVSWGFANATYTLTAADLEQLAGAIETIRLEPLLGREYGSDLAFKDALREALGTDALRGQEGALVSAAITVDARLILVGVLAFVACFAMSLGPIMWVLFSEIFPNRLRGLAVAVVGLVNSAVSFLVQLVFPWELANLGNAATFAVFGGCALLGLILVTAFLPETKGRSLEELEAELIRG